MTQAIARQHEAATTAPHRARPYRARWPAFAQWRRPRSLRARLIAVILLADCLAALSTGGVIVWQARIATKLEIASAMLLAQGLVADTIRLMQDTPAPVLLRSIDLHFQSVRHVRIAVFDAESRPVEVATRPETPPLETPASPPAWFERLVAPPIETRDFPIVVRGQSIGRVEVVSAPSDEIGEAWTYAHALVVTAACLNALALAALFLVFGRILAPLEALAEGLKDFESRNYAVRLPRSSIKELVAITNHFNRTAAALAASEQDNRRLNRQLLTAQDDERRRTAMELHDEVGPCLFALDANATSILAMATGKAAPDPTRLQARASDVMSLVERVQVINRRVLDSLRPMALGQIPLRESLVKLLVDFESTGSGPELDYDVGRLRESYGFLVDLTIYRCAQEGLLNAVRHARAEHIRLRVDEADDGTRVVVEIVDDGIGLGQAFALGRGLSGMRERVEALTGVFELKSSREGVSLVVAVPVERDARPGPLRSEALLQ